MDAELPDSARPAAGFARLPQVAFAEARCWVAASRIASRLSFRLFVCSTRAASGALFAFALFACAGAPPPPPPPPPVPVHGLLPASATLVVLAEPSRIVAEPHLREVFDALFPGDRLDAFRAHNGIDPRTLEALAYAEYASGTVLAIRGPFNARVAVGEMAHRMVPVESESDEPYFRRAGTYAGARRDAVAIDAHTLLVVTGPPTLTQAALRTEGRRALDGDGEALRASLGAELVVIWPEPLGFPPDTGVGMIFAEEQALGVSVAPTGAGIRVVAEAVGEFPPGIEGNLRSLYGSLARSDLGHQLGMLEAEESFDAQVTVHGVRASVEVPTSTLVHGLRALLVAELAEIVGPELAPTGP